MRQRLKLILGLVQLIGAFVGRLFGFVDVALNFLFQLGPIEPMRKDIGVDRLAILADGHPEDAILVLAGIGVALGLKRVPIARQHAGVAMRGLGDQKIAEVLLGVRRLGEKRAAAQDNQEHDNN